MTVSIKHKFMIIAVLNVALLIMMGGVGYHGVRQINDAKNSLVANGKMLTALLPAQNYRDNIRGVIFRGSAVDVSNEEEKKELQQEFDVYIKGYEASLKQLARTRIGARFDSLNRAAVQQGHAYKGIAIKLLDKQMKGDFEAFEMIGTFVDQYDTLAATMSRINTQFDRVNSELEAEGSYQTRHTLLLILLLAALSLMLSFSINYILSRGIIRRLDKIRDIFGAISKGIVPAAEADTDSDEIGQMMVSLNAYMAALHQTSAFATEIGKGNFDYPFQPLSDADSMGNALLTMRDNLKYNAEEEQRRNWAAQGLAEVSNLLFREQESSDIMFNHLLSYIVQYTHSNQGNLFMLTYDDTETPYLNLMAAYAWEKRKHLERRMAIDDGLIGQCVQEKETIYMTNLPADYIRITSGLGHALPRALLIVPLKTNQEVYGILELASFQPYQAFEIAFIEKLCEVMAASVAALLSRARTQKLLETAQFQAQEMRKQEEELQQNIEELGAVQEEMSRRESEYVVRIESLTHQLALLEKSMA